MLRGPFRNGAARGVSVFFDISIRRIAALLPYAVRDDGLDRSGHA
jgi:hypothetical protein